MLPLTLIKLYRIYKKIINKISLQIKNAFMPDNLNVI